MKSKVWKRIALQSILLVLLSAQAHGGVNIAVKAAAECDDGRALRCTNACSGQCDCHAGSQTSIGVFCECEPGPAYERPCGPL